LLYLVCEFELAFGLWLQLFIHWKVPSQSTVRAPKPNDWSRVCGSAQLPTNSAVQGRRQPGPHIPVHRLL